MLFLIPLKEIDVRYVADRYGTMFSNWTHQLQIMLWCHHSKWVVIHSIEKKKNSCPLNRRWCPSSPERPHETLLILHPDISFVIGFIWTHLTIATSSLWPSTSPGAGAVSLRWHGVVFDILWSTLSHRREDTGKTWTPQLHIFASFCHLPAGMRKDVSFKHGEDALREQQLQKLEISPF